MNNLLILHGWGSSAKNWSQIRKSLEKGVKVYIPDLPGFGENPPPSQPWSTNNYMQWVRNFSEEQNLSQFFLLGHSFGGGIAVKFVNCFPEKIQGLILVAPKIRREKNLKYYIALFFVKLGRLIFSIPGSSFLQPLAKRFFYTFLGSRDYSKLDSMIMKETFKKIIEEDLYSYLSKIQTKTLLLWGGKDKLIPVKYAHILKEKIKNSQLIIFPQIGHSPHLEIPEKLSQTILNFIK